MGSDDVFREVLGPDLKDGDLQEYNCLVSSKSFLNYLRQHKVFPRLLMLFVVLSRFLVRRKVCKS